MSSTVMIRRFGLPAVSAALFAPVSARTEPTIAKSLLEADRPNLTEQVYEQLIDILIRGELQPGDVIVISSPAAEVAVEGRDVDELDAAQHGDV